MDVSLNGNAGVSNEKPIRVGIAGLGRSGWHIHAVAIDKLPAKFQIAAVFDLEASRCQEAKDKYDCLVCSSVEELVSQPDIELVVLATPNHLHAEHAKLALNAGKHIVVEKPIARSVAELDTIVACGKRE